MRYLTKKHLSRRTVLRGAGVALALPFLESMIPAGMRTAAAAGAPRSRLACVYIPHGCVMDRWVPTATGKRFRVPADLEIARAVSRSPEHRQRPETRDGLRRRVVRGRESRPLVAMLDHLRAAGHRNVAHVGGSSRRAPHRSGHAALPSLELALEGGASISYLTPKTPLPMETNPRVVFERLLGDGSTPAERAARQRQLSSLLDSVTGQVAALKSDLPGPDRERLDRYLSDVREIERRLSLAADSALTTIDVPDKPNGIPADFEEHAMLMFDLLALAWRADLTRVADVHDLARGQQSRVSEERSHGGLPQRVAPLRYPGEHRPAREAERVSHPHRDRVLPAQAREHARRRRQPARPLDRRSTAAAWRTRTSTITTRCRFCSPAAALDACAAASTFARPRTRRSRICSSPCSTSSTCPSSSFGDSTGALEI